VMAVLTAKTRKKIPTAKFAGPARSYPVHDRAHAANAKARASQAVKRGNISAETAAKIHAKANRVLGKPGRPRGGAYR
jgi:hypothetical protein